MHLTRTRSGAVLAVGLMCVALSGCGGGGKSAAAAPTPTTPTGLTTASTPTRAPHKPAHPRKRHKAPAKPSVNHQAEAQKIATSVLTSAGLHVVSVTASSDGSSIQATVATTGACDSSLSDSQLSAQIEHLASSVHSVSIVVSGGGQPLDQYVANSCSSSQSPPSGPGRVVLQQKGDGVATTSQFTVHSASWTIAYVNNGRALNVFPVKGSTPTPGAVVAKPHSSGSQVEHGAGTYTLRISATGGWSIQVRDGT